MRQRFFDEQLQRAVIIDVTVFDNAAVAMVGVFAQTDVGHNQKAGNLFFDSADRLLHDAGVRIGLRAHGIFVFGNAEKNNCRDA